MSASRFERFLPISGILAGLCYAATLVLTRGEPAVTDGPGKRAAWFAAHHNAAYAAGFTAAYFCVFMLLFATAIRQALRSGEPEESTYSTAALSGGILLALSIVSTGALTLASAEAAAKHQPAVITTLGFIDDFSWVPWAAATGVLLLATGLGGLKTATLPKWLAITTIILGILAIAGPGGFLVFMVMPIWLITTGAVLHHKVGKRQPADISTDIPTPTYTARA